MPTVEQKMKSLLEDCLLAPGEAAAVMVDVKANGDENMQWGDNIEGYPPQLLSALWNSTARQALRWIDANKPQHFAREMFVAEIAMPAALTPST